MRAFKIIYEKSLIVIAVMVAIDDEMDLCF